MGYKVIYRSGYKGRGENYFGKSFASKEAAVTALIKHKKKLGKLGKKFDRIEKATYKIVKDRPKYRNSNPFGSGFNWGGW